MGNQSQRCPRRITALFAGIALTLCACGPDAGADAGSDASAILTDAAPMDAAANDGGPDDGGGVLDGTTGRDAGECPAPPAPPTTRLAPVAGELFYAQVGLGGFSLGESAILVGPDGTVVLVDVGNDSHDDDIEDALTEHTGGSDVDHIVVTHFHADHGDGIEDLLGRITWTGRIVYRGVTDITEAANDVTIQRVCEAAASRAGADGALCVAASPVPCDPGAWTGPHPATDCPGFATQDIALGAGATLDFFAANGTIGAERYETMVGPLLTDDSNGENARSVVALLSHGAFRMLLNGDLTGGGSDTDDVESFYVPRLMAAAGIDARGVDVLHAGHHGRNTSTNETWTDRLLPADGRSRNAVMGVSTAHVGSPHQEVLDVLFAGGRLGSGAAWTTRVAATGASDASLLDADGGQILLATLQGGDAYAIQLVDGGGAVLETRTFRSVGACP